MSDDRNFGSDSFTETTHTSWFSRLGQSIKGVLFGIVLIAVATILLFWNEGRAVQTARSLDEGAGVVVSVEPAKVEPVNESKLIHVSGDIKAGAALRDAEFGVTAEGLRLVRTVEMFQWKEESRTETRKNLGGSEETITTYSYQRVWAETRNDSSRFRRPEGHANPEMRYRRATVVSRDATLGAFRPGERVLQQLPADREVRVEPALADGLRGRLGRPVQAVDGKLYFGPNPSEPRVGDLRIGFMIAPAGPVSVIGRQTGSDFSDYQTKAGDRLLLARPGTRTATEMFKAAQDENRVLTWILRGVGTFAMFLGFMMILNPLVVVADLVPLIGSILGAGAALVSLLLTAVLAPLIVAVAWLWYRPIVSLIAIAAGVAVAYGIKTLASRRAAVRRALPMPAGTPHTGRMSGGIH